MRISTNVTYNDFIKNLGANASKVQKSLNQLSSLKEVSQSSDNPLLVSKIMNLNVSLSRNATFNQEIKDTRSWVQTQDSALSNVGDSMRRIRDLIQSTGSGTKDADAVRANKNEIQQEIQGMVEALNTNFDGRYIFGGQNTTEPPFALVRRDPADVNSEVVGIAYNGSPTNISREIADKVTIDVPTNGGEMMSVNGEGLSDLFGDVVKQINIYLGESDQTPPLPAGNDADLKKFTDEFMKKIDMFSDNIVNFRTKIGAVDNRLKSAEQRNESDKINLTSALSERQDVDIAEKYMEYQNQMLAYQTTMAMGTKIMQTSILDYVR